MVDLRTYGTLLVLTSLLCVVTSQTEFVITFKNVSTEGRFTEGTPLLYYGGGNGTLCATNLTDADVEVLCRQYGWKKGEFVESVPVGSTPIGMLAPSCSGPESSLAHCPAFSWGNNTSRCQKAARVKCSKGGSSFNLHGLWGLQGIFWAGFGVCYYKRYKGNRCGKGCQKKSCGATTKPGTVDSEKAPDITLGPEASAAPSAPVFQTETGQPDKVPPPPSYTSMTSNTPPPEYSANRLPPINTTETYPPANAYSTADNYRTQFS